MTLSFVPYELQDGYIHHWLVAGPQSIPVKFPGEKAGDPFAQIQSSSKKSGINRMPVERGPLTEGLFQTGGYQGSWSYLRCEADHWVDLSTTCPAPTVLRGWAYTQIASPAAQTVTIELESCGPVDLWLNKKHAYHQAQSPGALNLSNIQLFLAEGQNQVLLRFEALGAPVGRLFVSLRITGGEGLQVLIPTLIPSLPRRSELEDVYQKVYLDRDVYAEDDEIYLCWPEGGEKSTYNDVYFKNPSGLIQAQAEDVGKPGDSLFLGYAGTSEEGDYCAFVMPRAWEYYESQIRIAKELHAAVVGKSRFAFHPYGSLAERRLEALRYAVQTGTSIFAEMAKMALGLWQEVDSKRISQVVEQVNQRHPESDLMLVGLAGMLSRFGKQAEFPAWIKKMGSECLQQFPYEPAGHAGWFTPQSSETHEILMLTAQILAGQLYPNQTFASCTLTGVRMRKQAEPLALAWMQRRASLGFSDWDSPHSFAHIFTALSHLIDLARSEPVWGLAAVLLDKLLFSLSLNSFQGSFGSTRGNALSSELKSSFLEATSGISRVMWGIGSFNPRISGTVSAALLEHYELPANIAEIATFWPEELWSREQQAASSTPVNKVMYRTPDYMLSSAQDYRAGEPGRMEHIWQATLGPSSVVFSSHPACMSDKEEHAPNFWRGNGVLPRVAQWKDVLIALYRLPEKDRLGFTHVYFPLKSFDETLLREGWAFGRKGDGYIAITASRPFELMRQGRTANRELRAYGGEIAWLCHMGRRAVDGDFNAFQQKILEMDVSFQGLNVSISTLRFENLSFGWESPLRVNQAEQPLKGYKHFENPYCEAELPCRQMEIRTLEYVLRLDFEDSP